MEAEALSAHVPLELQQRLREASGRLKGERRRVVFLFADLVGSTALVRDLDLELRKLVMDRLLGAMIEPVVGYEGMVAQLLGDGLMAFFGAPLSHEDDADRALLAALEIRDGVGGLAGDLEQGFGAEVQVRIGVHAGEVIMGDLGSELKLEYTGVGDAIVLAQRLQSAAEPGSILVGEQVYRDTRNAFRFGDPLRLTLKGFDEPFPAHPLLRARVRAQPRRGLEGLESPMVGREAELAALQRSLADLQTGRGQIVLVLGEAGMGKSRLLAEAQRAFGEGIKWSEGRSLSYGTDRAYHPFADALRELVGIDRGDPPMVSGLKLDRLLLRLSPEERARHEPLLETLLGLPLDRQAQETMRMLSQKVVTERLAEAISAVLTGLAQSAPIVLVLDDLHWADASSVELLERLLPLVEIETILFALVMRQDPEAPAWGLAGRVHSTYFNRRLEIRLDPLREDAVGRLLRELLGSDLPTEARERILSRAEGSPFFLEEILRSLLEGQVLARRNGSWELRQPLAELDVPDSVQKVILSRLDRLNAAERRTLQAASVLGRHFARPVLEELVGEPVNQPLVALIRSEFLRERARFPVPQLMFRHWVTQEAVYETLLDSERRELHGRALAVLERAGAEPGELARHALAAGMDEPALRHSLAAGEEALRLMGVHEAAGHFARAVAAAERIGRPEEIVRARRQAAEAYSQLTRYPEARVELSRAFKLVDALDEEARAELLVQMGEAAFWPGSKERIEPYVEQALPLVRRLGRADLEVMCISLMGAQQGKDGDLGLAEERLEEATRRAEEAGLALPVVMVGLKASGQWWQGRMDASLAGMEELVGRARESRNPMWVGLGLSNLGMMHAIRGELGRARERLAEAHRFAQEHGLSEMVARTKVMAATVPFETFDYRAAEALSHEGREQSVSANFPPPRISAGIDLLLGYARRGEPERAEGLVEEVARGAEMAADFHGWLWGLRLTQARAELALARQEWEAALALAGESLERSRAHRRPKYEALALRTRGLALRALGREKEAVPALREAVGLAGRLGMPGLFLHVAAPYLSLEGDDATLEAARAHLGSLRAEVPEEHRRAFEASEVVRTIARL